MKKPPFVIAVICLLLPSCFLLGTDQYVSTATFTIESPDGNLTVPALNVERAWQAECSALAAEATQARFQEKDKGDGVWELRVLGTNPQLTQESCEKVFEQYLSKTDSGLQRTVLVAPSAAILER